MTGAKRKPGWQQKPTCSHIGLMSAALTIAGHQEGHEWVCSCGKVYVVVLSGVGRNKRLVAK